MDSIRPSSEIVGMDENNQVSLELAKCKQRKQSKYFPSQDIIHQIDMTEIKFLKAIGKGSFGVVHKAIWSGKTVAVKKVETDTEVTAFQNEIRQLSRVKHENIIQMYGTGSSVHAKCMVMEFASDGSLYQLLHCPPLLKYSLSHALGWLLQCAKAIAYLHSIEPRPIIHRDLKPLNMLLTNDRKVLKICDFGTACDLRSVMTDNKGSTVWMAPEVIKGCNYNEKCDVYSWGIILWELLTRRMPFKELGQTYRILWQVVNKVRPPLIQGCPKPIEKLMIRCWLDGQSERPSMQEVVEIVSPLYKVVCGIEDLGNHSPGDSYTESCVSLSNEELSENYTSHDVSEFTTSTNVTLDSPNHGKDQINGSDSCIITSDRNDQDDQASEGMNLPVVSRPTHSIISPVSPSILVLQHLENDRSDVTSSPVLSANSGRISFVLPPPPEMHTPLSVSIPNDGPAERIDVAMVCPDVNEQEDPAGTQHIPVLSNVPKFPWIFPPVNIPNSTTVCSFQQHSSVTDPLSSLSTITSLTSSYSHTSKSSPVHKRPQLQSHAVSSNWRRSAEVPYHHSIQDPDFKGHRRSSSYEFSKLIGFEPLAAEPLLEPYCAENTERTLEATEQEKGDINCSSLTEHTINECVDDLGSYSKAAYKPITSSPSSVSGLFPGDIGSEATPIGVFSTILNPITNSREFSSIVPFVSSPKSYTDPSATSVRRTLQKSRSPDIVSTEDDELGAFWQLLEDDLKPSMPMPSCTQSQNIFNDHKGLAHQLFVIQEEIVYLDQEKKRLLLKLDDHAKEQHSCKQRYSDKITQLKNKNETLRRDYCRLSKQLEEIRSRRLKDVAGNASEVPQSQQPPPNSSHVYTHHPQGQTPSPVSQDSLRHLQQQYYCDPHPQSHDNL